MVYCPCDQIISDFAFLPFGGGPRKCVGDQFALMESTIALAMLLQKFDVELRGSPESVELVTGATIHTKTGLWCKLKKRSNLWIKDNNILSQSTILATALFLANYDHSATHNDKVEAYILWGRQSIKAFSQDFIVLYYDCRRERLASNYMPLLPIRLNFESFE